MFAALLMLGPLLLLRTSALEPAGVARLIMRDSLEGTGRSAREVIVDS